MNTSVQEIRVSSEPDSSYFLRMDWEGRGLASGFQVLLTDGQKAWSGAVSEEELLCEAEDLDMQLDRYVQDLQEALTSPGGSAPFSFSLAPQQDGGVSLTYEKKQKNISFRLGCVSLSLVSQPLDVVTKLLRQNLQRGNDLKLQKQRLTEENQRLRGEQERMATQLKLYAEAKHTLEAELFSRFVLVLNEKKKKLRSLKEAEERMKQKQKASSKSQQTADQDDEYEGTTDEEEEEEESSATSDLPAPETARPSSSLEDSLSDITDVAPTRKRRFRQLEAPGSASTGGGRVEATHTQRP